MFVGLGDLDNKGLVISLMPVGIIIGIISFVFGCFSIRCPICKAPWVWLGVSGKGSNKWLHWLLSRSKCPKCNSVCDSENT